MFQERRAHERIPTREGTSSTFSMPKFSYYMLVGQVLDISHGGVGIKYLSNGNGYRANESVQVNMFCADNPIISSGVIPCIIAYDKSVRDNLNGYLTIRKCGLKYGFLTRAQLHSLECFINTCTWKAELNKANVSLGHAVKLKSRSLDG